MTKYVIYAAAGCGFCLQAKRVLAAREIDYDYIDILDVDESEKKEIQEIAGTQFRTVPQIFKIENDVKHYIGGYTQLMETFK